MIWIHFTIFFSVFIECMNRNIGLNISEQTKAEQQALDAATGAVGQYGTPINIPTVTAAAAAAGKNSASDPEGKSTTSDSLSALYIIVGF